MTAVYLIGAGPGDAGLITVRGLDCLRRADVVVHDHEVGAGILRLARPDAEVIDVGGAGPSALAQEAITYLIIEKVREGKVVARLKWGDPFVFDRGGEEALFLRENGITLELVPGVPLGIAWPEYAGIPLTYPGGGDSVTIIRGFDETGKAMPNVDWQAVARVQGTLLCYASAQQLPRVLDALVSHGYPSNMPAAIVHQGTLPSQFTEEGSIAELQAILRERPRREPGLLVAGRVVSFREHLRWFDRRPLFGRRVLVTRPREQASDLANRLVSLGAEAILTPMIRIEPPDDRAPLLDAAARAHQFDWIVFTSVNAVDAFMDAVTEHGRDARAFGAARVCAVGSATAARLLAGGIRADLVPGEFKAEAVFEALKALVPLAGLRVLLPRADIGREALAMRLREAGSQVTEVVAYRTITDEGQRAGDPEVYGMLLNGQIDAVTFTSASAVQAFVRLYGADQVADLLHNTVVAAIGPVTAEAAAAVGIAVSVQPATYTIPALVDAVAAHFSGATAPA